MVISNGIYKKLADDDAPDKTKKMKPIFERFEAVVNSSEWFTLIFPRVSSLNFSKYALWNGKSTSYSVGHKSLGWWR